MRNDAPASGLPRYVAGVEHPGQSRSLVSFAVPANATGLTVLRGDSALAVTPQREGGRLAFDDVVLLDPGARATWTLRYTTPLPEGRYSLRLVPQPLAHDATLRLDVRPAGGAWFGAATYGGPFDRERHVEVRPRGGHWWERLARGAHHFWDEPVRL
jgi:hypothetical protein